MVFDGTQESFTIDMPIGQTLEGWNAIAVWCVDVPVSFGSGAFIAPSYPDGDFNHDGSVDAADYTTWRDGLGVDYDQLDYDTWKDNFGTTSTGSGSSSVAGGTPPTVANVPEPVSGIGLIIVLAISIAKGRRLRR